MKKIITNENDAHCVNCLTSTSIIISFGVPRCRSCGSDHIIDSEGKPFTPLYGPAKMYRQNKYLPEQVCRRENNRPFPIIRDRRQS